MKYLVTGGAGFIASNFIQYMLDKYPEDEFINLDALTYAGHLCTVERFQKYLNYRFVKGDITDRQFIMDLFSKERFNVVVNFAAESHVDRSINDTSAFVLTNILGTTNLLDASKQYGVERYHQVGTDEVYGELPLDRPDLLFSEETPIHTSSSYSSSKASADLFVLSYYRTHGIPVTISRCSNNYGPYQYPEKLIPLMICRAIKGAKLPVYGNGLNIRDWIYVDDHCSAIDVIIHKGKEGEVYNVGGQSERTNVQVVNTILEKLNKSKELISFVADRPGHDKRYAIDFSKIKSELGWTPRICFEEGIAKTIEWYMNNEAWLREVTAGEYQEYICKAYGI